MPARTATSHARRRKPRWVGGAASRTVALERCASVRADFDLSHIAPVLSRRHRQPNEVLGTCRSPESLAQAASTATTHERCRDVIVQRFATVAVLPHGPRNNEITISIAGSIVWPMWRVKPKVHRRRPDTAIIPTTITRPLRQMAPEVSDLGRWQWRPQTQLGWRRGLSRTGAIREP